MSLHTLALVAALVVGLFLLRIGALRVLPRLARLCCFRWGAFRATVWLVCLGRMLRVDDFALPEFLQLESVARTALGQTEAAVAVARELQRIAREEGGCEHCSYFAASAFLHAGDYEQVLAFSSTWHVHPAIAGQLHWLLLQIHIAEARHRRGEYPEARARILTLLGMVRPDSGVVHVLRLRQAEMVAHEGMGEEALDILRHVDPEVLHRQHESDFFFARASALLEAGRYAEADREARVGLERARRAPSLRDGLFLRARIAVDSGRTQESLRLFEAGAAHPYKGQGGESLLEWGDCLDMLGRREEARRAWRLVLTRDPQSVVAPHAAARLGAVESKKPHWC
jgi:tetratricopeptide (TPR) repeat protein